MFKRVIELGQYKDGNKVGQWKYFEYKDKLSTIYDYDKNLVVLNDYDTIRHKFDKWTDSINLNFSRPPILLGSFVEILSKVQGEIVYPTEASEGRVQGTVWLVATVKKDGTITDFAVYKGLSQDIDKETLKVVNGLKYNSKWLPALKNGLPVDWKLYIGIIFRLL
jgi:vesicle coat complex subunit